MIWIYLTLGIIACLLILGWIAYNARNTAESNKRIYERHIYPKNKKP